LVDTIDFLNFNKHFYLTLKQKQMSKVTSTKPVTKSATTAKAGDKPKIVVDNSPAAKEKRFKVIAGRRTKKIIVTLANLGNCSNRNVYSYTQEQIDYIFANIQKQIKLTQDKFVEKIQSGKPDFELK